MGLFAKSKKFVGWMAIRLQEDGISVAYIKRSPSAPLAVEVLAFYPADKPSEVESLARLAKDLQASRYQCSNLLASNEYQMLSVDAPNVPGDELKTAIRWRLK